MLRLKNSEFFFVVRVFNPGRPATLTFSGWRRESLRFPISLKEKMAK